MIFDDALLMSKVEKITRKGVNASYISAFMYASAFPVCSFNVFVSFCEGL